MSSHLESIDELQFNEAGLIPAVIQSSITHRVLMVAWMNREAISETFGTGDTVFFSRSRQELWHKGKTSGNTQKVLLVEVDCDRDCLLIQVEENGPACHNGTDSCFDNHTISRQGA